MTIEQILNEIKQILLQNIQGREIVTRGGVMNFNKYLQVVRYRCVIDLEDIFFIDIGVSKYQGKHIIDFITYKKYRMYHTPSVSEVIECEILQGKLGYLEKRLSSLVNVEIKEDNDDN